MTRRTMTLAVSTGLLLLLLVAAARLPVPYIALMPGPLYDTLGEVDGKPVITVEGKESFTPQTGTLYLTTVRVAGAPSYARLTLFEAVKYWVDPSIAVVPTEVEYPPGTDVEKIKEETAQQMVDSQDAATIAAMRYLGENVTTQLVVESVTAGAPADGVLEPGDKLLSIDGVAVDSASGAELRDLIRAHPPGDVIEIRYERAGKAVVVMITTTAASDDPTKSLLGIGPDVQCPCKKPFIVKIGLGEEVGGPSAGLMFTLGIIDTLTPGELTRGMSIAGTGTMDVNGNIGPIGGIKQKLIAAKRKGATAFLVPDANWEDANVSPPKGLQLRRVKALPDAVRELCALTGATEKPCAA
ncbi:MAG: S16 family serine protease [Mycobacteriales bacterium]